MNITLHFPQTVMDAYVDDWFWGKSCREEVGNTGLVNC